MNKLKFLQITVLNIFIINALPAKLLSQVSPFLPKFPVRSATVIYNLALQGTADPTGKPFLRFSFDNYGESQAKEYIDEISMMTNDGPFKEIFRINEIIIPSSKEKIATKYQIKDYHYMSGADEGFIKLAQDLIKGKINKSNTPEFISFRSTGSKSFLGLECQSYEYKFVSSVSNDKMELLVYHEICLSKKYYIQDSLYAVTEATSYQENIPIPVSVFNIPEDLRVIDGDKLETISKDESYPYSTIVVEYKSVSNVGDTKEDGKKTLYIKDKGKYSCEEFTGTRSLFSLSPEKIYTKDIHNDEYEYRVDLINQNVRRSALVPGNYYCKSAAERKYIFDNKLYDNNVKLSGTTNFLGNECRMMEIRLGLEKLEILEWSGIFLKTIKYICYDDECSQQVLLLEETATGMQINIPINNSVFFIP